MLRLRLGPRRSHSLGISLLFRKRVVCTLSSSLFSLLQCYAFGDMPYHILKSSYLSSTLKLSVVLLTLLFFANGTRNPTQTSLYCSPILSLYPIAVRTRLLLDQLITVALPPLLQGSSEHGSACDFQISFLSGSIVLILSSKTYNPSLPTIFPRSDTISANFDTL